MRSAVVLVVLAACGSSSPDRPIDAGPRDAAPAKPIDAATIAIDAPPACAPLAVEIPDLAIRSKHDAAVPPIVDFDHELDGFYAKLAKLARGERITIRIGVYGDSNLANDRTPGNIRRQIQARWGDAGHGWVSFGHPWGWYQHWDILHGTTGTWQSYNLSNSHAPDYFYGFAGTAAESDQEGATAWVATAKAGSPVGTKITSFDLHYLARPHGGTFDVLIDGEVKDTVEATATEPTLAFKSYDLADGPHRLAVRIKRGRVRVFGVALERAVPGIILDSLGVGSLNPWLLSTMNQKMAGVGLARRDYDLIIETSGSNMCASKWIKSSLETWREALPKASVMLWTAPDAARFDTWKSDPLMEICQRDKRGVAERDKLGFWDLFAALGGPGSMPRWLQDSRSESWAEPDGLHLGPHLNKYIAERFVHAILTELAARATSHPRLGCD